MGDRVDHGVPVVVDVLKHGQPLELTQIGANKCEDILPEEEEPLQGKRVRILFPEAVDDVHRPLQVLPAHLAALGLDACGLNDLLNKLGEGEEVALSLG